MDTKIINITKNQSFEDIIQESEKIMQRLNNNESVDPSELLIIMQRMNLKLNDESKSLLIKIQELKDQIKK